MSIRQTDLAVAVTIHGCPPSARFLPDFCCFPCTYYTTYGLLCLEIQGLFHYSADINYLNDCAIVWTIIPIAERFHSGGRPGSAHSLIQKRLSRDGKRSVRKSRIPESAWFQGLLGKKKGLQLCIKIGVLLWSGSVIRKCEQHSKTHWKSYIFTA